MNEQQYVAERSDGTWWLEVWPEEGEVTRIAYLIPLEHKTQKDADAEGQRLLELLDVHDYFTNKTPGVEDVFIDNGMTP